MIYAKPCESLQQIGGSKPDGWIVMQSQRPSAGYTAQDDGTWEPDWHARIAAERYTHEIGGTTFTHSDGNTYGADTRREQRGTMAELMDDAQKAKDAGDTTYSEPWLTPQGWIDLTADDAIAMVSAVKAHVRACFVRQRDLDAMVKAGTITEQDLAEGWPEESP